MPKCPWPPYVITRNSWSFAPAPKNAVHFLYGAALHRPAFWPPLQSVFAKDTAFLSAKAQKLQKAQLFAIVRRSFMEESCFGFGKAKETALLKKRQKSAF